MKTFLLVLITAASMVTSKPEVLEATFITYEDDTFYFEDTTEKQHTFSAITPEALDSFDLKKKEFEGEKFKITYYIDVDVDEDDEEYDVPTISGLELLK